MFQESDLTTLHPDGRDSIGETASEQATFNEDSRTLLSILIPCFVTGAHRDPGSILAKALTDARLILPQGIGSKHSAPIYSFIKDNYADFQFHFVEGCGKTAVQQAVYNSICLKYTGGPLIERRRAKRFQVDWQIRVEGNDGSQGGFVESGVLRNISSSGALLSLTNPLPTGTQLDVYIKLPLKGKKWMKYPARVVRIEPGAAAVAAAVRFDSARPDFGLPLVPM